MCGQCLGCESCRLWNVDVSGVPTARLHTEGGVSILSHGLSRNSPHFIQSFAAGGGTRATEEGGIPEVVSVLDNSVEKLPFVRNAFVLQQVPLERIGGVEEVG